VAGAGGNSLAGLGIDRSADRRELNELRASMLGCIRCAALTRSRSCVVPGDGAVPAAICFIGLAPGRLGGDRTGIPFSGDRSGELLRRMILKAVLTDVFITNLVRCNPQDAAGRNRDPDRSEIANCRSHLTAELKLVRPRIVACLGRIAWRELAGMDQPFTPRQPCLIRAKSFSLYPLYHPAYINRGACSVLAYADQFHRLARLAFTDMGGPPVKERLC
jgi:uracil-DNA glycosylase family 4